MSMDKSLRRKNTLVRQRSVLTRGERIKQLRDEEKWKEDQSPFGLPKVKVHKVVIKKAKKAKEEVAEGAEGAAAAPGAAAPAAGAKPGAAAPAAGAKPAAAAAKKPEGKKDAKK
jgi:small basic protein (TIGR04137 family)